MKSLSLKRLKAMYTKINELQNLDSINGGSMTGCHIVSGSMVPPKDKLIHHKIDDGQFKRMPVNLS